VGQNVKYEVGLSQFLFSEYADKYVNFLMFHFYINLS